MISSAIWTSLSFAVAALTVAFPWKDVAFGAPPTAPKPGSWPGIATPWPGDAAGGASWTGCPGKTSGGGGGVMLSA